MDLGRTIAIDIRSGDLYLDPSGNTLELEGTVLLEQSADILLNTQKGEDLFALQYGFDAHGILSGIYGPDVESAIDIALTNAFASTNDSLFLGVKSVSVSFTPPEGSAVGTATVNFTVNCISNITISTTTVVSGA